MSTKDYSSAQEKFISEYLGWQTVVASGARSFHPGDIKCKDWLGECKTHTSVNDKITFNRNVWKKICDEAASEHRYPALFVDNGIHTSSTTWVMFPYKHCGVDNSKFISIDDAIYSDLKHILHIRQNISFDHVDLLVLYRNVSRVFQCASIDKCLIVDVPSFDESCGICILSAFSKIAKFK